MTSTPKNNPLHKVLGLGFGIAILIGGTIGVGILRTPGEIAALLDNYWLIIGCWIAGGIFVLMGCGAYAELATSIPKAGGSYNYVKRAFGDYAGFISGWFDYITNAIAPAVFCIVISEYIIILFPALHEHMTLIAIAFLIGFLLLHTTGVKTGSIVQQIISTIKVLFFVGLIVACFMYTGVRIPNVETHTPVMHAGFVIAFFKSLQMVLGAYDGWYSVSFFAEEDENPSRNIPRSLFTGALIVMAIYVLLNMAYFYVLPVASVAHSPLVASDVAKVVFGERGSTIVTVIAIFSIIGILNAFMMIPPRILYGLSRDGYFIPAGQRVNSGGTPIVSLLISSAFSLTLICIGSFNELNLLGTFFGVTVWSLSYISLIKLRISEPDLPRPFKTWGYPVTPLILVLVSLAILFGFGYSDRKSLVVMVVVTVLSWPVFRILKKLGRK
ncbi:APC family permease [Flavobacterium silvaticum]|uniref:APC family permease n=1 Tax=Flavobacterium silvaticum TaxID=1852020 RepID=A0A972FLY3_9FLAO|nr:APC family permease [Flavobacterium silvaticum]NMH28494.1 APC family permease [Flavobacterium silvaticum]